MNPYTYQMAYNYQRTTPLALGFPPRCSESASNMEGFLIANYGGQLLGCYGDRAVRGGTSPSTHAYGQALDWRYSNVGGGRIEVGRANALIILDWLIGNARYLGIQQIHDYLAARIWKIERGWRDQPKSGAMGAAWAQYFHIEFHPDAWHDQRPIVSRGATNPPRIGEVTHNLPFVPPTVPTTPPGGIPVFTAPTTTASVTVPSLAVLRQGHSGPEVVKLQALLRHVAGQEQIGQIDGKFGPATDQGVRNVQAWFKLTVDGIVGPQTWRALLDA